jgi:hypothetical protein
MGADRHTRRPGCADRSRHRVAIAGVSAARHVHRGQERNQGEFRLECRFRRGLADVGVQVNLQKERFLPRREDVWRKKEKGTT